MSVHVSSYVWTHSQQKGTALVLLLAIAEQANDDGIAWPGIERLAKRARCSERNVQLLIRKIEGAGELEVEYGVGRNHTNVYGVKGYRDALRGRGEKVKPLSPFSSPRQEKVKPGARKGEIQHQEKVKPVSPEPSVKNPEIEPSVLSTEKDSLQSSFSVPESEKLQKQKSPEDHTGKLIDDLEEIGVYLDKKQIDAYSGNFGALKRKGVPHSEIVRSRQRIVSEWPRVQLSPQQALSDLRGESRRGTLFGEQSALEAAKSGERRRGRGGSAIWLTPEQVANPKETYAGRI